MSFEAKRRVMGDLAKDLERYDSSNAIVSLKRLVGMLASDLNVQDTEQGYLNYMVDNVCGVVGVEVSLFPGMKSPFFMADSFLGQPTWRAAPTFLYADSRRLPS